MVLLIVSTIITLLTSLFIQGKWSYSSPVIDPRTGHTVGGIGKGFPFYWYRYELPASADGTFQIGTLVRSVLSFSGDILFWFLILFIGKLIVEKTKKVGGK